MVAAARRNNQVEDVMTQLICPILTTVVGLLFAGSAAAERPDHGRKEVVTIRTNTEVEVGDLRIAAENSWEDEFTNARKLARTRHGASLFVSLRLAENESKEFRARVH